MQGYQHPVLYKTKWSSSLCSATTEQTQNIKYAPPCITMTAVFFLASESLPGLACPQGTTKTCCSVCPIHLHFFCCRTAFNYHTESPFTQIIRGRPKASKTPHYTVNHYIQGKSCTTPIRFPSICSPWIEIKIQQSQIALYFGTRNHNWSLYGGDMD